MKFIKDIFKSCMGTMMGCGCSVLMLFMLCFFVLPILVGIFSAATAPHQSATSLQGSPSVLVIDLSTSVVEASKNPDDLGEIFSSTPKISMFNFVKSINRAKDDSHISAILIKGNFENASVEQIWETLEVLKEFKKKKPVFAYLENAGLAEYLLASCATKIYANPMGDFEFKGMSLGGIFIGNALKKYGVDVQVIKAGKYKSFGEMFTSDKMSDEAKENLTQVANSIWENILSEISQNRNLPIETLKKIAGESPIMTMQAAKKKGFIDEVCYKDEFIEKILDSKSHEGYPQDDMLGSFKQIAMYDYANIKKPQNFRNDEVEIAIVYMRGSITESGNFKEGISSEYYCALLKELRMSDSIRSVILRIDSGGGSAYASEQIRREIELLAQEKFVYASFGDTAASGAYWLAMPCEKIYAGQNAITGSIGVFGLNLSVQQLAGDFGITFDKVKTEKFADIGGLSRSLTDEEIAIMQGCVDNIYDKFLTLVSEGRKIPRADVEKIAQGKIYTAEQAQKIHLIDGISSLNALVGEVSKIAKEQTGVNPVVREYPQPPTFFEILASAEIGETPFAQAVNYYFARGQISPMAKIEKQIKDRINTSNNSQQVQAELPIILEKSY